MTKHRSGKRRLSPFQNEILRILEEAGEENLTTVANTLQTQFPAETAEGILDALEHAYMPLVYAGLVSVHQKATESGDQPAIVDSSRGPVLVRLQNILEWSPQDGYWRWNERVGGRERARFRLTRKGEQSLTK